MRCFAALWQVAPIARDEASHARTGAAVAGTPNGKCCRVKKMIRGVAGARGGVTASTTTTSLQPAESHTDMGHAKHRACSIVGPTSNRQEEMMIRDKLSDTRARGNDRTGPAG